MVEHKIEIPKQQQIEDNIVCCKRDEKLFIDLFAGCGGLSLGLISAGWKGLFAVEKNPDAFSTFKFNLIDRINGFEWPSWLPVEPSTVTTILENYSLEMASLKDRVTLIAGGPPCQGFSYAGRRKPNDPRNQLFKEYLAVVAIIKPRFLLFENVRGITQGFKDPSAPNDQPYSDKLTDELANLGYCVFEKLIACSDFGVPQLRHRFILIAVRNGDPALRLVDKESPFDILYADIPDMRERKGIASSGDVSVYEAISDLEVCGKELIECIDSNVRGFKQIDYNEPDSLSAYQKMLRAGAEGLPNSLRLPNHQDKTIARFKLILASCPKGRCLDRECRKLMNIRKHSTTPLDPNKLSAAITTLPDDIIHYSEPRILTVRENARIQSFPDSYAFLGHYTTGGKERKSSCPRYTQVGNAVPPLVAESIGVLIAKLAEG